MKKLKIIVVGYKGKMGSVVFNKLKVNNNFEVVGIDLGDNLTDIKFADILIDFGGAECSIESARWCKKNNVKLIIGSTGQNKKQLNEISNISKTIPILLCQNFSLGIIYLLKMLSNLNKNDIESVFIFEKHHKNKIDEPSGTALKISDYIAKNFDIVPKILSMRGGKEIGTHEVYFYLKNEVLKLCHQAFDREAFACGVEKSINIIKNITEPKLYNFEEFDL